jgi:hypothetical protein
MPTKNIEEEPKSVEDILEDIATESDEQESEYTGIDFSEFDSDMLALIDKAEREAEKTTHKWVERELTIVVPITPVYESSKQNYEMFDAQVIVRNKKGERVKKEAKIVLFSSLRTQLQKFLNPPQANGKINRRSAKWKSALVGQVFSMQYTGMVDSLNHKGKQARSIIVRHLSSK